MPTIHDLSQLIADGKKDEIRSVLKQTMSEPLSDADRGQALVMLGMLYIQLKNKNDESLLADLAGAMETLRSLSQAEKGIKDAEDLASIRARLNS